MTHSELYHKTLLASRHALIEASQETQDAIVEAYGQVIRGIIARVSSGKLTPERAAKLAKSIEEELKVYGKTVADTVHKGALKGATAGAMGHKYALAKLLSVAGVAVELGHTFDEVPALALEALATRRGFIGGYAKMLATVQKRGLQSVSGSIDNYLVNMIGQGISADEATKGLAHIMADSVPTASKGLIGKYLGPKGGFAKGLSPAMKKYLASPAGMDATKGARALLRDARRIAVHEINSAHHEADSIAVARSPVVDNVRWQLSGRHANLPSSPDRCDILAAEDFYELGPGVFPSTAIPPLPHPYCLCKVAPIVKPVSEWGTKAEPAKAPIEPLSSDIQPKFKDKMTQWSLPSNAAGKRVVRERKATAQVVKQSYAEKLPEAEPIVLEGLDFDALEALLAAETAAAPPTAVKFDIANEYDADVAKSAKILEEHDIQFELNASDWDTAELIERHGKVIEEMQTVGASTIEEHIEKAVQFWQVEGYVGSDYQEVVGWADAFVTKLFGQSTDFEDALKASLIQLKSGDVYYVKGKKVFPKFLDNPHNIEPEIIFSTLRKNLHESVPESKNWSNKELLNHVYGEDIPKELEPFAFPKAAKTLDPDLEYQPSPSAAKEAVAEVKAYPNTPEDPKATAKVTAPPESIKEKLITPEAPATGIPDPGELEYVKELGGSTGAKLYRDPRTGKRYVVKRGASPDHLREESLSDNLYEAAGARVPSHRLVETPDGPVKVAEYVEGQTLKQWQSTASARQIDALRKDARRHFAYDVLFGNWDVAGLDMDNILVAIPDGMKTPKVFRIDNGGSLRFRAMGTRKSAQEWSSVVTEIDSLRGKHPSIKPNRGAEWLYGGMTDKQAADSVMGLLKNRDKILAAAPPEIREVLAGRMDSLARWLDEFGEKSPKVLETKIDDVLEAIPDGDAFTDDVAQAIHDRKALGHSILTDEGDIEDNQLLAWWRYDKDGDAETLVSFKLRRDTAVELENKLRASARQVGATPKTTVDPVAQAVDNAWNGFLKAVKTVNHHVDAGDFAYNKSSLDAIDGLLEDIKALHAKGLIEKPDEWIKLHDLIVTKASEKQKIPVVTRPEIKKVPPPKATPKTQAKKGPEITVKTGWDGVETKTIDGVDRVVGKQTNAAFSSVEQFTVKTDDFEIRVAGTSSANVRSYHGYVEIRVPGRPTPATMAKIRSALEEIGQVSTAAPIEYREALYIFRTMNFRRDVFTDSVRLEAAQILGDKSLGYGLRLERLKELYREKVVIVTESYKQAGKRLPVGYKGLELPNDRTLRKLALGRTTDKDGGGFRTWERFDLPDSELEKLEGTELSHASGMKTIDLVKAFASRGGHVTSTFDRARLGIPIDSGASPITDLRNGPGTHFYTQLLDKNRAYNAYGKIRLVFSPRHLRRIDSVHAGGDFLQGQRQFTDVVFESMAKTAEGYLRWSKRGSNEALFKGGFSLYEVEKFVASSLSEKYEIEKFLKQWHGSDIWPDGRNIEDIVEVR